MSGLSFSSLSDWLARSSASLPSASTFSLLAFALVSETLLILAIDQSLRRPFRGFNYLGALVVLLHLEREVFLKLIVDPQFARLFIFFAASLHLSSALSYAAIASLASVRASAISRYLGFKHLVPSFSRRPDTNFFASSTAAFPSVTSLLAFSVSFPILPLHASTAATNNANAMNMLE